MDNHTTTAESMKKRPSLSKNRFINLPGKRLEGSTPTYIGLQTRTVVGKTEENNHIYSVDGENFGKTTKITDIPAEHGDELYVDTVPVELTDEFIEVLRRGVRVFYLRRLTLFNLMYERLGIKTKSAKNDVRVLMALETKWFREVDEDYLVMRRLFSDYRSLLKSYVSLTNRMNASSGVGKDILKDAVKSLEEKMTKMAEIIVSEAG